MGAQYARLLAGLYGSTFLARASSALVVVVISAAYKDLSPLAFSLLIALIPLAELVCVPLAGVANDRYGRRTMFVLGLALMSGALLLRALLPGVVALAFFNLVQGAAAAVILVTSLALLADHAPKERRGREMGIFDFVTVFGYMVGFIGAFVALGILGDDVMLAFGLAAVVGAMATTVAYLYVREPPGRRSSPEVRLRDLVDVARKPSVALIIGPWFIVFLFIGTLSGFLERTRELLGYSAIETALGIVVMGVILLVTQVGYGHLSDRHGRAPMMILGALGFFVLMSTVALILWGSATAEAHDPAAATQALSVAAADHRVLLGIAFLAMLAFGPAALAALADEAEHGPTGVTMSLYSLCLSAGFIFGPVLTATAVTVGGAKGLALWFELLALSLAILVLLRYRHELGKLRSMLHV